MNLQAVVSSYNNRNIGSCMYCTAGSHRHNPPQLSPTHPPPHTHTHAHTPYQSHRSPRRPVAQAPPPLVSPGVPGPDCTHCPVQTVDCCLPHRKWVCLVLVERAPTGSECLHNSPGQRTSPVTLTRVDLLLINKEYGTTSTQRTVFPFLCKVYCPRTPTQWTVVPFLCEVYCMRNPKS